MNTDQKPQENTLQTDKDLSVLLKSGRISRLSSKNPLRIIKKNLMIQIVFGILICFLYVLLICWFRIWPVQVALGIVFLFSLWAMFTALQQYKKIAPAVSFSNSLLAELKRNLISIHNWMRTQERVALFIYPVSAAGGFMLGGTAGSGKPVGLFMSKPIVLLALLIVILFLLPVCYFLTRWLFRYYFGRHLDILQQTISEMETEE